MKLLAVIAAACMAASVPTMRADHIAHVIVELAKRQHEASRVDGTEDVERVVEEQRRAQEDLAKAAAEATRDKARELRSIFEKHPKQKRLYTSKHKRKATRKTRRAGATAGGVRELLARSIEIPGHRASVIHTTRIEARERAWLNDTQSGFLDIVMALGTQLENKGGVDKYMLGSITVEIRDADSALVFSNGSHIELLGLDNLRAQRKKRGNAKHVMWIDEAQDFRFLSDFYKAVVIGSLNDYRGECWLSGTPGSDCSGLFYEATREDEERNQAWEVHEVRVTDNPYFGVVVWELGQWFVDWKLGEESGRHGPYADEAEAEEAAARIRWENTAGRHIRENNLREEDGDVQREWYAKWVTEDLAYVFPVHVVPKHVLVFAPQRLRDNPFRGTHRRFDGHPPWYDHELAMRDLPRKPNTRPYQWLFGLSADFGYWPDPFAIVIRAFTRELPGVYEMFSWKHTRVMTDDQGDYLKLAYSTLPNCIAFVGDPAGKRDDFEVWRTKLDLPIEEANKAGKNTLEEFLASAIRANNVHYRGKLTPDDPHGDSPLLREARHLVYLPKKPGKTREVDKHRRAADGVVYGDHCLDADRYLYQLIDNHLYKAPKEDNRSELERQEAVIEERIDRAHEIREAMRAQAMDVDDEYGEEWDW